MEEEEKVPSGVKRNPTQEAAREVMKTGSVQEMTQELEELSKTPDKFLAPKDFARKRELERRIKIEEAKRRVAAQAGGGRR